MHELLEKQHELHDEATEILSSILLPILERYGEVVVGGSYLYELMCYPDIDIDVVTESVDGDMYARLCAEFLKRKEVSKLTTTNRVEFENARAGSQKGYWISPKIHFGELVWSIDIWLQKPEWHTGNTVKYKDMLQNITDEQRIAILSIKEDLRASDDYGIGKKYQSVDVYDAVLKDDVLSVEDFRNRK